jgi:hypothetical protein
VIRSIFQRRGRVARGALLAVEAIVAIASLTGLALGLVHHFETDGSAAVPGEGKRIVAFRQVTNRICTEHRGNLHRALDEAGNRIQRLDFVARAMRWDVNDLEGVTPPPSRAKDFLDEVAVRRQAGPAVLSLQQALESRGSAHLARAIARIASLEGESREFSRSAGIVRCMKLLPATSVLVRR